MFTYWWRTRPRLKPKDGYAVRAILPRPERRGLSRTESGHTQYVFQTLGVQNAISPSVDLGDRGL